MQVVGARIQVLFRPDPIDQLLPMQDPTRRKRERDEHLDRTPLGPGRRRHHQPVHFDRKSAKKMDARDVLGVGHDGSE